MNKPITLLETLADIAAPRASHTALPWFIEDRGPDSSAVTIGAANPTPGRYNLLIADLPAGMPTDRKANAELICRAVNHHDRLVECLRQLVETPDVRIEDMQAARAAIAQATRA